jgi:hypothetical protein
MRRVRANAHAPISTPSNAANGAPLGSGVGRAVKLTLRLDWRSVTFTLPTSEPDPPPVALPVSVYVPGSKSAKT